MPAPSQSNWQWSLASRPTPPLHSPTHYAHLAAFETRVFQLRDLARARIRFSYFAFFRCQCDCLSGISQVVILNLNSTAPHAIAADMGSAQKGFQCFQQVLALLSQIVDFIDIVLKCPRS